MSGLWLAWSECEDRPRVQREVKARDHGARILWLDELQALEDAMGSFDASIEGVALCVGKSLGADALDALEHAAGACGARTIVLTRDLDPAWIAQLFHAGASEVVSAHGDVGERQERGDEARAEGSSQREAETGPVPDENRGSGERPAHRELTWNAKEVAQDASPREQSAGETAPSVRADGFDDLDEPESEEPPRGAAARPEAPRNVPLVPPAHTDDLPPWDMHPVPGPVPVSMPAPVSGTASARGAAPSATAVMASGHRAPVVCALSGKGGSGVTALVTTMASCAAHLGLRTALLDLDLMFGNAYELLGVEALRDLGTLVEPAASGTLGESDIVQASMRVAPGLTLWGPIAVPERAELLGRSVEALLGVLRRESDVVFVDTSRTWTDAVASTVAACERCLLVCDQSVGAVLALERVISMVARLGVPRTRMVCVVNRFGSRGCTEEEAIRLEMAASLSAKARIADGGTALSSMLAFGKAAEAARSQDAFGKSVRSFSRSLLRELGCSVGVDTADDGGMASARPRLHLPWKKAGGAL